MAILNFIKIFYVGECIHKLSNTLLGWSNVSSTSICNGVEITGGFNIFGGATISEQSFYLPEHYELQISITFYAIDSWDREKLLFFIDTELKVEISSFYYEDPNEINICGQTHFIDHISSFSTGWNPHTNRILNLKIQIFLNQSLDDESLGWKTTIEFKTDQCFKFYSQPNYQGREFKICRYGTSSDMRNEVIDIWSFQIPKYSSLILQGDDFNNGMATTYTTDVTLLEQPFQFPKQIS